MDQSIIDWYDLQMRPLLQQRMDELARLDANHHMMRDSGEGWRRGNLASEFLRVIQGRLFKEDIHIEVNSDDPEYTENAGQVSLLSNAIARVTKLQKVAYEATSNSCWAGYGVLSVGHPLDPFNLDVMRSVRVDSSKVEETIDPFTVQQDEWAPVDKSIAEGYSGGADIIPFDAFARPQNFPSSTGDPQPLFNPSNGLPWVESVDPRLVLFNREAKKPEQMDFVVRLHFLTVAEIQYLTGVDVSEGSNSASRWSDLFLKVYGQDMVQYPDMVLVAQIFIRRHRSAPQFNDWHLMFLVDRTDMVLRNEPNPMRGFCPLSFVKLKDHQAYHDKPEAERLADYADMFDLGMQSLYHRFKAILNTKTLIPMSAGMDQQNRRKMMDDNYRGAVECRDPSSIQDYKPEGFTQDFFLGMSYIKNYAQGTSGGSDIDRGVAVKGITARQTQGLLENTSINVGGMKACIESSLVDVLMKLMWLVGKFDYLGGGKSIKIGEKLVVMDAGSHDFVNCLLYNIQIRDTGSGDVEGQLALNQLLRTIGTNPQLGSFFDLRNVAIEIVNKYSLNPRVLAHNASNPQPQGQIAQGTPGFLPGGQNELDTEEGMGQADLAYGQHPERASRGAGVANQVSGMSRIGVGG
jgi:hypothetical protein